MILSSSALPFFRRFESLERLSLAELQQLQVLTWLEQVIQNAPSRGLVVLSLGIRF